MNRVSLTVNDEPCSIVVEPRTQLAEVLRDHLHLTGTHLGCEQGVCGACTVVVDGKPVRSCITYAHACEGAAVETIEGLADDPTTAALRDAFSRHHALQCGFCTPGMLVTARDVVLRLAPREEAEIRRELSGNLCRCTGYMGIVAAVKEVAARAAERRPGRAPSAPEHRADRVPLTPFELAEAHPEGRIAGAGSVTDAEGWSRVERKFTLPRGIDAVWDLFEDLPRVARCLPGTELESGPGNELRGRTRICFGPIRASFEGTATRTSDREARRGSIGGRAEDRRGRNRLQVALDYALREIAGSGGGDTPAATGVEVTFRFRIQGSLAQFNRPRLVDGFADLLLKEFAENCARELAGETVRSGSSLGGFALLVKIIKALFGR